MITALAIAALLLASPTGLDQSRIGTEAQLVDGADRVTVAREDNSGSTRTKDSWPFDQAPNVAALSTRQVVREGSPILVVTHYADDHSWAFTCGTTRDERDAMVVGMGTVYRLDATLKSIADLPPGWSARREHVGGAWTRTRDEASPAQAEEECTFNREHQVEVVATVAKSAPDAVLDAKERSVEWRSASGETTTFGYGGCVDFGSTVTRATPMDAARTREQVFALARELAERFWNAEAVHADNATNALLAALDEARFDTESFDGKTLYNVADEGFAQLYVEHEFADGVDRVMIAWQGNF